jgi:hypothetical protein
MICQRQYPSQKKVEHNILNTMEIDDTEGFALPTGFGQGTRAVAVAGGGAVSEDAEGFAGGGESREARM